MIEATNKSCSTYGRVANVAFDAFSCYSFTKSEWLKADVAIRCGSADHRSIKLLAWAAVAIHPAGLLVLNATLLYRARDAIQRRGGAGRSEERRGKMRRGEARRGRGGPRCGEARRGEDR